MQFNNKIEITSSSNGYIITWEEPYEENNMIQNTEVIEEMDDDNRAMKVLLERVAEHFGYKYDKFGKNNLNITFDLKGRKYYDEPTGDQDSQTSSQNN